MFVGDELLLAVSFPAAQARLADLTGRGLLAAASGAAYSGQITGLAQGAPRASARGVSRLARVRLQELTAGDDAARLAVRWEVTGPGGGLFPVLDADITLAPAGADTATLALAGAYRPPLGTSGTGLDQAVVHQVAVATIRAFLNHVAQAISHPAGAANQRPRPPIYPSCRQSRTGHDPARRGRWGQARTWLLAAVASTLEAIKACLAEDGMHPSADIPPRSRWRRLSAHSGYRHG